MQQNDTRRPLDLHDAWQLSEGRGSKRVDRVLTALYTALLFLGTSAGPQIAASCSHHQRSIPPPPQRR
jgi:hypothetical protein